MGAFAAGQVVLLTFPFSDLSRNKLRPAVVLATVGSADYIVCQITSNPKGSSNSIRLDHSSFVSGGLDHVSYVRPGKIFTAHHSLIASISGVLVPNEFKSIRNAVIAMLESN